MRAHLVLVKLPYTAEGLQPELEALVAVLPQGSRRVIDLDRIMGFLVPHTTIANIQAFRWREVMRAFSDWWIIGLNGELACKNKSHDPFWIWMDELRRTGEVIEGDETKNMTLPKRGEPGVQPSINDLIERTFGKVGLKPSPDKNGPKEPD